MIDRYLPEHEHEQSLCLLSKNILLTSIFYNIYLGPQKDIISNTVTFSNHNFFFFNGNVHKSDDQLHDIRCVFFYPVTF